MKTLPFLVWPLLVTLALSGMPGMGQPPVVGQPPGTGQPRGLPLRVGRPPGAGQPVGAGLAPAPVAHAPAPAVRPGVLLVGLRAGASAAALPDSVTPMTGDAIPALHLISVAVPAGQERAAADALRHNPHIAFAEPDYAAHIAADFPDDPGWPEQWGPARIGAPTAWHTTTGSPAVVIAILDTGVKLNHEDLSPNLWLNADETPANGLDDDGNGQRDDVHGWHFFHEWAWDGERYTYLPREDGHIADDNGHGTHVAGIAGARIDNGRGIAGLAGHSRLMIVKVLDRYGDGWYSDIAKGIVYAVDNGAQVINLSLGGESASETLQAAVDYAYSHGVLVVAASGNDGGAVLYPAAGERVLAVAATDEDDERPAFSNHGPAVDIAAPGVDIYSTWWRLDGYYTESGTSMAAPHVSGLAALLWSVNPFLTPAQVSRAITGTAQDVNGTGTAAWPGWDEYLGWGLVDCAQAIAAVTPPQRAYLPLLAKTGAAHPAAASHLHLSGAKK